jgi:hypothetical protein
MPHPPAYRLASADAARPWPAKHHPLGAHLLPGAHLPGAMLLAAWLVLGSGPTALAAVTLSGVAAGHPIALSTSARTASAVSSVVWNGVEFIDDHDHGRQLQSASNHGVVGQPFCAEGYNPTQAGSVNDGAGPTSTSTLTAELVAGNQLTTAGKMAFWQAPGQTNPAGCTAYNTTLLSDHGVSTKYTLGVRVNGLWVDNLIRHDVTFTIPDQPGFDFFYHQFEALTGYMPPSFSVFRSWNPASNQLNPIAAPNAEQPLPLIVSTPDSQFAMGVYSPGLPQAGSTSAGYGGFVFPGASSDAGPGTGVSKWNVVYREGRPNQPQNLQTQQSVTYTSYLAVGTVQQVQSALATLVGIGAPRAPVQIEDFGFENGSPVLAPLGQGAHSTWGVDRGTVAGGGVAAVPVGNSFAQGLTPPEGRSMAFTRSQPKTAGSPMGTPVVIRNVTNTLAIAARYELSVQATSLNLGPGNGYVLELGYQAAGDPAAAAFVPLGALAGAWSNPGVFRNLSLTVDLADSNPAIGQPLAVRWTNNAENIGGGSNNAYLDNVRLVYTLPGGLAGDYNDDGVVDAADYTAWRDHRGALAGTLPNDLDGGPIGVAQYETWKQQFGARLGPPPPAAAGVPEPAAGALLLLGAALRRGPTGSGYAGSPARR